MTSGKTHYIPDGHAIPEAKRIYLADHKVLRTWHGPEPDLYCTDLPDPSDDNRRLARAWGVQKETACDVE